jgi:hypothetical protein
VTGELPEPSFEFLVTQLATQALIQLGDAPSPLTGEPEVALSRARFTIGLLQVLLRKTVGHLDEKEQILLSRSIGHLERRYRELDVD